MIFFFLSNSDIFSPLRLVLEELTNPDGSCLRTSHRLLSCFSFFQFCVSRKPLSGRWWCYSSIVVGGYTTAPEKNNNNKPVPAIMLMQQLLVLISDHHTHNNNNFSGPGTGDRRHLHHTPICPSIDPSTCSFKPPLASRWILPARSLSTRSSRPRRVSVRSWERGTN